MPGIIRALWGLDTFFPGGKIAVFRLGSRKTGIDIWQLGIS